MVRATHPIIFEIFYSLLSMDTHAPSCIGIILDGNRRWAREQGLPTLEGHRVGLLRTLKNTTLIVRDFGIPHFVVYLFSTENWNREAAEVAYLMDLFREAIHNEMEELRKEGVRVRFVGQRERFAPDLQQSMNDIEKSTQHNTRVTLWCCLSYGGRAEIVEAARNVAKTGEEITEASFAAHLWTAGMPDPDLIIRTGGEHRLSNFLLWQAAYSELFFPKKYWPDFTKEDLADILREYEQRQRRFGA